MNLSGIPVIETLNFFKIKSENLFVVHDDLDLKLCKLKIKSGGRNAGHNGLLSIDNAIGKKYNKIRIGINRPIYKKQVVSYVLEKFSKEEFSNIHNRI